MDADKIWDDAVRIAEAINKPDHDHINRQIDALIKHTIRRAILLERERVARLCFEEGYFFLSQKVKAGMEKEFWDDEELEDE